MFVPNLNILPTAQRALWPDLGETPEEFTLYGGTALALRLGHRTSLDFDFFSKASFDPDELARNTPYIRGAERVQVGPDTLTVALNVTGRFCCPSLVGSGSGKQPPGKRFRI